MPDKLRTFQIQAAHADDELRLRERELNGVRMITHMAQQRYSRLCPIESYNVLTQRNNEYFNMWEIYSPVKRKSGKVLDPEDWL